MSPFAVIILFVSVFIKVNIDAGVKVLKYRLQFRELSERRKFGP